MLLDHYPGLTRGLARIARIEEILRTTAMTALLERINGIPVRQFTPRHMDLLILARSPFLYKRQDREKCSIYLQPEDVALFLWIVSPENPLNGSPPPSSFYKSLRPDDPLYFQKFYRAIDSYKERATIDQPPSSGCRLVPTSLSAAMVHRIASAYGIPAEVFDTKGCPIQLGQPGTPGIKDMPIAQLNQYVTWILLERDPRLSVVSPRIKRKRSRIVNFWKARAKAQGITVEQAVAAYKARPSPFSSALGGSAIQSASGGPKSL